MKKTSCTTATNTRTIVNDFVNKELDGDYSALKFNYMSHQKLTNGSIKHKYSNLINNTELMCIDCKRIGKGRDLEEETDP